MAEKRVSVRLAAVGGNQVKAELTGIGDAGKKGFGKASREMEIANARLAKFARRAKIAVGIMTAAAAAAGIAMVRSGLKTIDEQAKLAASLRTTTASMQILSRAAELAGVSQGEVEQATIMMTKSLSQAAQGTGPAVKALKALNLSAEVLSKLPVDKKMIKIQDAIAKFIPTAQQAAVASQIFGARAGLIFTRIDSSTLRQAKKDVVDFGVATSEIDAVQVQRTNDALSRMGLLWRGISNQMAVAAAPALEDVANAMVTIGKTTGFLGRAIKGLFNHIGEITSIAAAFAAVLGGRLAVSLGAAVLGIRGMSLSLVVLRGALIRTGIGALIVGAGELVYWFGRLVKGAGGFGNALLLLKNVAVEVWSRIKRGAKLMSESIAIGALSIKGAFTGAFATIIEKFAAVTTFVAKGWNALIRSMGMESNATGLGSELAKSMRRDADYIASAVPELRSSLSASFGDLSGPLKSMQALRNAMKSSSEDVTVALKGAGSAADSVANSVAKAGKASKDAADIAKSAWASASKSLEDYSTSSMDISKGVSDTLTRGFKSMEGAFKEFVKTGKTDFSSLVSSMLADLALLEFKKAVLGPLASSLSGAFSLFSGTSASILHEGGLVGSSGPSRMVPSMAFAGAPRMHNGGWAGVKPNEIPAILQRGERVLSRREVAAGGSGSTAPLQIELRLSGDLDARIAREARGVAVTVVRAGIDNFSNEALPHRVHQIARDGKAIG